MRSYILLTWISGSTNRAGTFEAWTAIISLAVPTAPLFLMTRWFAILPLGAGQARSGGLRVTSTRLLLAALAAAMTAISSFLIRQLSLTGQIAPHLSRLIGFHRSRDHLLAATLIGAGLLVLSTKATFRNGRPDVSARKLGVSCRRQPIDYLMTSITRWVCGSTMTRRLLTTV
jgi:iron complex transport system permease protein